MSEENTHLHVLKFIVKQADSQVTDHVTTISKDNQPIIKFLIFKTFYGMYGGVRRFHPIRIKSLSFGCICGNCTHLTN